MGHALKLIIANDEEESGEARQSRRSRVLLSARVQNAFGEHPVKLRDISCAGAKVEAAVIPPIGSRLLFIRGSITVAATVVWREATTYGVRFADDISEAELLVNIGGARNPTPAPKALFPARAE